MLVNGFYSRVGIKPIVRSRGWVAVTKKKVNLILDLEEGDFILVEQM